MSLIGNGLSGYVFHPSLDGDYNKVSKIMCFHNALTDYVALKALPKLDFLPDNNSVSFHELSHENTLKIIKFIPNLIKEQKILKDSIEKYSESINKNDFIESNRYYSTVYRENKGISNFFEVRLPFIKGLTLNKYLEKFSCNKKISFNIIHSLEQMENHLWINMLELL